MLSVVVPFYNEESVIEQFYAELSEVLKTLDMPYEVICVDDGSSDSTAQILSSLRDNDPSIAVIELSRNFGKEIAVTAGLDHARGDAVVVIDSDLQDPPELIPTLVEEWRNGYDVVYGRRASREGESLLKIQTARWFYRVINRLSDVEIPVDTGDYRLLSRRAVDALNTLRERHRYMKGLYAWVGFPQKEVLYHRRPRAGGSTKWNYWRLWNFAIEGITSFSDAPLKLATYLGTFTSAAAFLYGTYFFLRTLLLGNPVPGYPSLIIIMLFLGGVQLVCLGILGEYMARTYNESKDRALYFVKGYHPSQSDKAKADEV